MKKVFFTFLVGIFLLGCGGGSSGGSSSNTDIPVVHRVKVIDGIIEPDGMGLYSNNPKKKNSKLKLTLILWSQIRHISLNLMKKSKASHLTKTLNLSLTQSYLCVNDKKL